MLFYLREDIQKTVGTTDKGMIRCKKEVTN